MSRDIFELYDDDKFYLKFEFRGHGRTRTLEAEYNDDVQWGEVLDDLVSSLEAAYEYSFDIPDLGIHYKGKENGQSI